MTGFERYKEYLINERKASLDTEVLNSSYKGKKTKGWAKAYRVSEEYKKALEEAYKTDKEIVKIHKYSPESKEGVFYFTNEEAINDILNNGHKVNKDHIENYNVKKAIKELDLHSLDDYYTKYEKKVISKMAEYFKTNIVRYYERNYNFEDYDIYDRRYPHSDKKEVPISVDTIGDFMDEYEKVAFKYPCLVGISYCKTYFQKHFLNKLISLKPDYIDTPRAINKFERACSELLTEDNSLADRLAISLEENFKIFNVLDLLRENEYYKDNINDIINTAYSIATLQSDILDTIPGHYPDLYPNARNIKRHFILHIGPTNSGKTYSSIESLKKAESGVYLAPLRLLAYEQFDNLNKQGIYCNLLTGEESIEVPCAEHTASTIEMLNMDKYYKVAVIDEAQMIGDNHRGGAWTKAILGVCADEVHICLAPEAEDIVIKLIEDCGDDYEIHRTERQTALMYNSSAFYFPTNVKKGDALIVFSRNDVHTVAAELNAKKISCSIIYGNLPYDVRHKEAEKFNRGETDVVVATDAIGMGLNMPIKRVIFLKTMKYDGNTTRMLLPEEVRQIAGRAGRYGIYDEGFYGKEFTADGNIQRLYNAETVPVVTAYLPFPQSLITLNVNLSRILKKWNELPSSVPYYKSNLDREIELCTYLEDYTNNKQLIYDLITIPFSDRDDDLREIWNKYSLNVIKNKESKYENYIHPNYGKNNKNISLDRLEKDYKICDLVYYFATRFWHNKEIVKKVMEAKAEISRLTMIELDKKALKAKTCNRCGHKLAWNHPYNICEDCYYRGRRRYNYYDFDGDLDLEEEEYERIMHKFK